MSAVSLAVAPALSYALPQGGAVVGGSAAIAQTGGAATITQSSNRALINWNSFDISSGETVTFQQPSASAIALNRVTSGGASQIHGSLSANGNVWIINPQGVLFGSGAQVNVGGLLASTADLLDSDFMAGHDHFSLPGNPDASIINQGSITAAEAGLVGLVAPSVLNSGVIQANLGKVQLAGADRFALDLYGDGLINLEVSGDHLQRLENTGSLIAHGGSVLLTTEAAGDILSSMVSNTGSIDVSGMSGGTVTVESYNIAQQGSIHANGSNGNGGNVFLKFLNSLIDSEQATTSANGASGGHIEITGNTNLFLSGLYEAKGTNVGGSIFASADNTRLFGARLDASGDSGGEILIGGGWQGTGALKHALTTDINFSSTLKADGLGGNGGTVVVWSDSLTRFAGTASATSVHGAGGAIEVSSKESMQIASAAVTDASSVYGVSGSILFDPKNITIATGGIEGLSSFELVNPNPSANDTFGASITTLSSGNVVVLAAGDDFAATDAGAAYLFNGATGALISTLRGSTAGDQVGLGAATALTNGNYVINSFKWNNGGVTQAGAVTWGSGITGVSGTISAANSLVGSMVNDLVGVNNTRALNNGNYVVLSNSWSGVGAVTWGNGTTGISGTISAANSLVGSTASDNIGGGFTALTNGNYVVHSTLWDNGAATNAGAVTWGNGLGGTVGVVSAANSLIGSTAFDQVGLDGVTALSNGNYVVGSRLWDNGGTANAGAVTWGNGATGISGTISAANSLIGSTATDVVGNGGITVLSNSNYVVRSQLWDNGGTANVGAVTWVNGTTGLTGAVSAANSLVGSTANDQVGAGVVALTNGNYVVYSSGWDNGGIADVGAATWGNGSGGTVGAVSAANSLVGSTAGDGVGDFGITALTNGNYVVISSSWNNGAATDAGAVTWGNGLGGTVGVVSTANSLVGSTIFDRVGFDGTKALSNGNYVVSSRLWDNGGIVDVGAVTWGNGLGGTVGVVSAANSLVGSSANDWVGQNGIKALSNGNYVVSSTGWDNGGAANVGAVTWGNGTTGISGTISAANSLVGSTANDQVGGFVLALTNGNYVVASAGWDNGGVANVGAVTWGNGLGGTVGVVSAANSLVGSSANDQVGVWFLGIVGIVPFANGDYMVPSGSWDNGGVVDAGAVSVCKGTGGCVGAVSSANSLLGTTASSSIQLREDTVNGRAIASFYSAGAAGRVFSAIAVDPSDYDAFAKFASESVTLAPGFLTRVLNTGANVTLQASNDITIANAILSNNPGGNGGALTFQAGRSILVNASIDTDNGNLNLYANDLLANGVVDAEREAGAAVITMAGGVSIHAGSGTVTIELRDGLGLTNNAAGDITLGTITAGSVFARNVNASGDMILSDTITASGAGDAITLVSSRNFINNGGAGALVTPSGRWLSYSTDPEADILGGLGGDFSLYECIYGGACGAIPGSGSGFLYSIAAALAADNSAAIEAQRQTQQDANASGLIETAPCVSDDAGKT